MEQKKLEEALEEDLKLEDEEFVVGYLPKQNPAPTEEELKAMALKDWIEGKTDEMPEFVSHIIPSLEKKLTMAIYSSLVTDLGRVGHLSEYQAELEKVIFNKDDISNMAEEDLVNRYKEVRKAKNDTLEYTRRMLAQNGTRAVEGNVEGQAILALLNTFSADQLKTIKDAIISGKVFEKAPADDTL